MGNNITCSTTVTTERCNIIYPRDMVFFGYVIVSTLYKGENKAKNSKTGSLNTGSRIFL